MQGISSRALSIAGAARSLIGETELFALHDGTVFRERVPGFIRNASEADFTQGLREIGLPEDRISVTFTTFALRSRHGVVVFDPGFADNGGPTTGRLAANLAAVGIAPGDVLKVVISHFHGDHILGLRHKSGDWTFPNAEILVPEPEWDYWMDETIAAAAPEAAKAGFATARRIFAGSGERVSRFGWNRDVAPGITALPAPGHTPGHTAFLIADGKEHAIFVADITNNPYIFARHPGWHAHFDVDPVLAEKTRRAWLDRLAQDRSRALFFHAPFPSTGYVARGVSGYDFIPQIAG